MRLTALMKRRGCGRSKVLRQQHLNDGGASRRADQPAAVLDAGASSGIAHSLLLFIFCAAHPQEKTSLPLFFFFFLPMKSAKDDNLYNQKGVSTLPLPDTTPKLENSAARRCEHYWGTFFASDSSPCSRVAHRASSSTTGRIDSHSSSQVISGLHVFVSSSLAVCVLLVTHASHASSVFFLLRVGQCRVCCVLCVCNSLRVA